MFVDLLKSGSSPKEIAIHTKAAVKTNKIFAVVERAGFTPELVRKLSAQVCVCVCVCVPGWARLWRRERVEERGDGEKMGGWDAGKRVEIEDGRRG